MLSFDISAIDVALSVVILILFLLFVTQRKSESRIEATQMTTSGKETQEEPEVRGQISVQTHSNKPSADGFQGCVHQFGHLRSMPKSTAVPEECFGCPKVLRCMFQNE
jgi:hypothetical protein